MRNSVLIWLLCGIIAFGTSCKKDDDDNEPVNQQQNNNNNNQNQTGTNAIALTGNLNEDLGEGAEFEIDENLLRFRIGGSFTPNVVMNYNIENGPTDLKAGTYKPVSATYGGQPDNEMAFQYNNSDSGPYFGEAGNIEITEVTESKISGTLDVQAKNLNGKFITFKGDFEAIKK